MHCSSPPTSGTWLDSIAGHGPKRSRWAGLTEEDTDGNAYTLYGDNCMGLCLMAIRNELQNI